MPNQIKNIKKLVSRFYQFGGWRLVREYIRMGLGPTIVWQVILKTITLKPYKKVYPYVMNVVNPFLRKKYAQLIEELCKKYKDANLEHKRSDIVWFCWLQGIDSAPDLVKACLASQQACLKKRDFRIVTLDNYSTYVSLPIFFVEKYKKGIIPAPQFSDCLRLELLIKYGGTWIDSTVLFSDMHYPPEIMNCDLFLPQRMKIDSDKIVGVSNWFITSNTNNELLMVLRDVLYAYWQDYDCLLGYYMFHSLFMTISKSFPNYMEQMPRYDRSLALQMCKELNNPYRKKLFMELLAHSSFHKLDYRKDKLEAKGQKTFLAHIIECYLPKGDGKVS